MTTHAGRRIVTRSAALLVAITMLGSTGAAAGTPARPSASPRSIVDVNAYESTKTITRTHLVNGADDQVDSRRVTVSVDTTTDLKDRQAVNVSWSGAHPTGGLVADHNSGEAARQEYPVVVMQCRGVDSTSVPAAQRISPQTCWTQTPDERFQFSESGYGYPSYRMDRYASTPDRSDTVGQPAPLPDECPDLAVPHWVPFAAEDGTVYPGGRLGCAGLAPEAANAADSLQPGSTTYGVADARGNGTAKFVMQNQDSNASLGCSDRVKCTLVVIPVMGISCDAAGTAQGDDLGMPTAQRPPPVLERRTYGLCAATGQFEPGDYGNSDARVDLTVTGSLWWSASNWRNRFSVPLSFAPSASVCDVVGRDSDTVYGYGTEALLQATQQWQPHFCLNPKLYTLRHVQTSETQAKNLLNTNAVQAAFQAAPPSAAFARPTVQAPTAISGWAVAFSVDGKDGEPAKSLRLNARLLAKLLSESYLSCTSCLDFESPSARASGFSRLADNPIDISRDPEFRALNPDVGPSLNVQSAATMEFMSSDSDVMHALTSYIDADPEAREWLNGVPDPWGMVVNPAYKQVTLPVDSWPLLDTTVARLTPGSNSCLEQNPVPWLPLIASPVSNPATVALHLQFDIANSQINCKNNQQANAKLTAIGRETPGQRFVLGLVSYADAAQYQIPVAQLQSRRTSEGDGQFDDASGRTFVGPSAASLRAAVATLTPDDETGTWPISYSRLRESSAAYPGLLLISTDIATTGLGAKLARQYATFLRFVAGAGQRPGRGIGELPVGYLPMTSANGAASFAAYTRAAADEVAAQKGRVPFVSGAPLPADSSAPRHGGRTGSDPATSGSSATGAAAGPVGGVPAAADGPVASPAPAARSTPSTLNAEPVGKTSAIDAGALGMVLPLLVIAALAAMGVAAWNAGIGRRP